MANDGTLNQRESGVGIFDAMTFQNDTPIGGEAEKEQEEESRQAHEAAYGNNDNQATPEEESGMMFDYTTEANQQEMTAIVEAEQAAEAQSDAGQQVETEEQAEAE